MRCLLWALFLAPADDLKLADLDGAWDGARYTEGRGDDASGGERLQLTFKDGKVTVRKASGAPVGEATLTLAADGRSIDALGTTGAYRNKTYPGIVKLEGDSIRWCLAGTAGKDAKRPADFTANPGSAHYLIVAKRRK
jgi:uncharacterized protein (TIGR03067 family)